MTWIKLWAKLGKQPIANNRKEVVAVVYAGDLKELIAGKADWEAVELPLELKFTQAEKGQRHFFILRKGKGQT